MESEFWVPNQRFYSQSKRDMTHLLVVSFFLLFACIFSLSLISFTFSLLLPHRAQHLYRITFLLTSYILDAYINFQQENYYFKTACVDGGSSIVIPMQ